MKLRFSITFKQIYTYFFPGKSLEEEIKNFILQHPHVDIRGVLKSLNDFIIAIEHGDKVAIQSLVRMNEVSSIQKYAQKNVYYSIEILPLMRHVTLLDDGTVKIKGKIIYKNNGIEDSVQRSFQGMQHYFIFTKFNGTWVIVDTNFHKKLSFEYFLQFLIYFVFITILFFLIPYYFGIKVISMR